MCTLCRWGVPLTPRRAIGRALRHFGEWSNRLPGYHYTYKHTGPDRYTAEGYLLWPREGEIVRSERREWIPVNFVANQIGLFHLANRLDPLPDRPRPASLV